MRTPREESMSVSTEEGEASERIVSEMIIFSFKFPSSATLGSLLYPMFGVTLDGLLNRPFLGGSCTGGYG